MYNSLRLEHPSGDVGHRSASTIENKRKKRQPRWANQVMGGKRRGVLKVKVLHVNTLTDMMDCAGRSHQVGSPMGKGGGTQSGPPRGVSGSANGHKKKSASRAHFFLRNETAEKVGAEVDWRITGAMERELFPVFRNTKAKRKRPDAVGDQRGLSKEKWKRNEGGGRRYNLPSEFLQGGNPRGEGILWACETWPPEKKEGTES